MIETKLPSPSKLNKRRSKDQRVVYRLTSSASMKFKPERQPEQVSSQTIIDRIKSFSRFIPFRPGRQSLQVEGPSEEIRRRSLDRSKEPGKGAAFDQLQFLFLMDHETYLIGTRFQITALSMSLLDDYIEVDNLWSMSPKSPILHLQVDPKRRSIVMVFAGELQLLGYDPRRSKNQPKFFKSFKLVGEVKIVQYAKDSLLAVFFQSHASFFIVDQANSRQLAERKYKVDKSLKLYRAAQCVQGVLNVFFTSDKSQSQKPVFVLWCVAVEFTTTGCEMGQAKIVYQVEERFRSSLRTESITRDCFLINLGREIIMFKKGYCVDRVAINYQVDNTFLRYFSDRRLVHVSPAQIDFYNVIIDLAANPPKITLKSTDSIVTPERKGKQVFMDVLRFQEHKMGFFYQQPAPNLNGEVKYDFALTLQWDFEQKVNSLLPRVSEFKGKRDSENPQFQRFMELIEHRCDSVGKMGVSRKQAYLRIWRESGKQSVQQFKLLLDTLDYATIREQITLKLKKRSMQWVQVHKIEQGCLGMLQQVHFGQSGFSVQGFRNYLVSSLLVRKLQLFKELRLFEREAGKLKISDRGMGDKLMINIQEYTTLLQMDIKNYLLELISGLCKKKDLATQIRIVIRKFKFAFRHIYSSFLQEIVAGAKEELLYLLQVIPQLLPYTSPQADENPLLLGVWGNLKEQQWQKVMYFDQVATVFNRQMVEQFSKNIWIKRNWLTSHDVIFLSRPQIQKQFISTEQSIFYCFLARVFEHLHQDDKLSELLMHLQVFYPSFPGHLVDNVFLYRKLFLYFSDNKFMNESFEQFLRRRDDEIFKHIFDHQKYKKGSLLRDIKPIYEGLGQGDKFNYGLLKFFSSGLSEVSDIKYLLNRINNEKWQFHSRNQQMYQVLIRGMQIKLKLGSERDIPIEQVLIYITNIPLGEGNALTQQLQVLRHINGMAQRFKKMKLNMSVFQMIRNRDCVLMRVIAYDLEQAGLESKKEAEVIAGSLQILSVVGDIRRSIYGEFQDNDLLFMFLVTLLERKQNVRYVRGIIAANSSGIVFGEGQLESVVYYCYRRITTEKPRYQDCKEYLSLLVGLLDQGNHLRVFVESELQLAGLFESCGLEVVHPISGKTGVISQVELEGLVNLLKAEGLLGLDLRRVHALTGLMRESLGIGLPELSLYWLYEQSVRCLLRKGRMQQSLLQIQAMYALDESNPGNIIYPLLVYRNLSCEFIEENKNLMLTLISMLYTHPGRLLAIFIQLISKSFSNEEQRQFLLTKIAEFAESGGRKFNPQNILFDQVVIRYLSQKPERTQDFYKTLQQQLAHFLHLNHEYAKSIDLPIFNTLLIQSPELLVKYLQRSRGLINLRDIRCLLSYMSKYQIFDSFKVLQYGKRLFKVLYYSQANPSDIDAFIVEAFALPLTQIENLGVLSPEDDNLAKLSKGAQKFKGKLKSKISSSAIMMKKRSSSGVGVTLEQRFRRIDEYLSDFGRYVVTADYPYNDSDCETERQQKLKLKVYQQPSSKGVVFDYRKFLLWLLKRRNQVIEYYLVRANENQVEEQIKRQEQILKQSFKFVPKSGKAVVGASMNYAAMQRNEVQVEKPRQQRGKEVSAEFMNGLPYISSIPFVQGSGISVSPLQVQQLQQVVQGSTMFKNDIIGIMQRTKDGKGSFRAEFMGSYTIKQLQPVWLQLLRQIYFDEKMEYAVALSLIGDIYSCYQKTIQISSEYLEIYMKMDQLKKKVDLDVPIRSMLPFEGLLIKDKDSSVLFAYLKDNICLNLNENNVHTLPRLISLAFKKTQFQQELNNEFLKTAIREFSGMQSNSLDENLKLQRIGAFAKKMPLSHLKGELQKIMEEISGEKREKIVRLMSEILRGKNDGKGADSLQQRWLNPEVKGEI